MNRLAHPPETKNIIQTEPKEWHILFTDEDGEIESESALIQFDLEFNTENGEGKIIVTDVPEYIKARWYNWQEQIQEEIYVEYSHRIDIEF